MEKPSSFDLSEPLMENSPYRRLPSRRDAIRVWLIEQWVSLIILLLLLYITIYLTMGVFHESSGADIPYSPANSILKYERQRIWNETPTIYSQGSWSEIDAAWNDLLIGLNIRAFKEEMILGNEESNNSVQLADGTYLATLGVYHQLHCVDTLRRAVHTEHYHPTKTDEGRTPDYVMGHWDHCVEILRRSVMCHADLAMYSIKWIADSHAKQSKELRSNGEVTCVNWEAVENWSHPRALKNKQFYLKAGPFEGRRQSP